MPRTPPRKPKYKRYDPEALRRELYNRSVALTRSAHALTTAASQLVQAHGRDSTRSAAEVRTAAFAAMLAALGAYELIGGYDLAAWLDRWSHEGEGIAP